MRIYLLIIILIFIESCSREEYLSQYQLDNPITFNSASISGGINTGSYSNGNFTDTVKTSKTLSYSKIIEFESVQSLDKIEVFKGSTLMFTTNIIQSNKKYQMTWSVDSIGSHNYQIVITQKNGQTKIINCQIYSFINWSPLANFVYDQSNKRLDFSSSYDTDARFGGSLISYKIYINGILRKNDNNPYFYATVDNGFNGNGKSYTIKVEVVDSDNAIGAIEKVQTI